MAATAPAVPATIKLGTLHRKSSCQMRQIDRRVVSEIATATIPEFTMKYAAIAPTTPRGSSAIGGGTPPPTSRVYTTLVAAIVSASADMLKAVRYQGSGCRTLSVHCVHAPATAIIVAGAGPIRISAIRSAAYDIDSVQLLFAGSDRFTFQAE